MNPPQTADQINLPQTGSVEFTNADSVRSKMVELFENIKPTLQSYHQYAESVFALSQEYHSKRMLETFPNLPMEEGTLAHVFDARETPASLDTKLAELKAANVIARQIIFDRTTGKFYLYV